MNSKILWGLLFLFFAGSMLFAQNADSTLFSAASDSLTRQAGQEHSLTGFYIRTLFATIAIVIFILLMARWYKKVSGQNLKPAGQSIRIIARRNIAPKQFILIVGIEDKKIALGVTDHSITPLADLGELSEEERQSDDLASIPNFSQVLKKIKKR